MPSTLSFGVRAFDSNILVETVCPEAFDTLQRYIFPSLPRVDVASASAPPSIWIRVELIGNRFELSVDGVCVASTTHLEALTLAAIKSLDEAVISRLTSLCAVHAGAVVVEGQALLLPGTSHAGKSSLVAELLRRGATCLSDEYALIDLEGRVHPYPRPLLLRNGKPVQSAVLPQEINSCFAVNSAPVGWILELAYQPDHAWSAAEAPQGEGVMMLLRNTPHVLAESPHMLHAFMRAVSGARCYAGYRGDASQAVDHIFELLAGTVKNPSHA